MAKRVQAKSIGIRGARKLLREVDGAPAPELLAELKRVLGFAGDTEVYRLTDGRVVDIFYGSGRVFDSVEHDTCVGGFPCRAGSEVYFDKSGEPFGGTLSRTHSFGTLLFGSGTQVGYGKVQKGVREASRERSLDPLRKFRISHAGKPRSLNPSASRSR